MQIAVILGSQRKNGMSNEIENKINQYENNNYVFIRMAETIIDGCIACQNCANSGKCEQINNLNDMFAKTFEILKKSDVILIITPIYAPYPSRLIALIEKLFSISWFGYEFGKIQRPLLNKKVGIVCYGSSKIEDDKHLKIIFQKIVSNEYSFTEVSYDYINNESEPNKKYKNIIEYIDNIMIKISEL
ncbi:hypothetical protein FACS189444_0090 [Spirochaetia bacterium]|nr:hypothetical protein FACS189444_0090 [Spirochaetia bacterium]